MSSQYQYFLLHKPYGTLSQFTREEPHHKVLGDHFDFPTDIYPVGRLDRDSEGLLILTDDKRLNERLLHPRHQHQRMYWAQVEGLIDEAALQQLRKGVRYTLKKKTFHTLPAQAEVIVPSPKLAERDPPIRVRKNIPDSWLALSLMEGKNRQVRKMCAAVGYPVLRLIRSRIESLELSEWVPQSGDVCSISREKLTALLRLQL